MAADHDRVAVASVEVATASSDIELAGLDEAFHHIASNALTPDPIGTVGLEIEMHLVDLAQPSRRVPWDRLMSLVAALPPLPAASAVTIEPGGQVELSTVPAPDIATSARMLEADCRALSAAFIADDLGFATLGADPARPVERMNPKPRYAAMEQHFRATGSGIAGPAMMCSTAALQLNVNAGPAADWPTRVSRLHRLGPVLVAISACSPWLAGESSGWRSMRQQMWGDIDQARCGPLLDGAHPDEEWASYALMAPVMLIRDPRSGAVTPVTRRVPFADWASGGVDLGRAPTTGDLDYHLSTLFPPVRPKGFLEIRCLDAVPDHWWPGLAGIAATLMDDPVASDAAAEVCQSLTDAWTRAARDGLRDPEIARAARDCVAIAVERAPLDLAVPMVAYADLIAAGRTPGDDIAARAASWGPVAVLESLAKEAIDGA